MPSNQLKEYCEAEFENIDGVVFELFSVVKAKETGYTIAELAVILINLING